jgi:hypothetical protein
MPWAAGVYTRGYPSWSADAASNLPISATKFDTEDNDFAAGLNNCLTKDGLNTPSSPLSWSLSNGQILQLTRGSDGAVFGIARTGGSNNPSFKFNIADTGGLTVQSSYGPFNIAPPTVAGTAFTASGASGFAAATFTQNAAGNGTPVVVVGNTLASNSYGVSIQAGTNATDAPLRVLSAAGSPIFTINGAGNVTVYSSGIAGAALSVGAATTTSSAILINALAAGEALIEFDTASTATGYVGTSGGTNQVITGAAAGDMNIRSQGGRINFSANSGASTQMQLAAIGTLTILAPSSGAHVINTSSSGIGINCTPPASVMLRIEDSTTHDAGVEFLRQSSTSFELQAYNRGGAAFVNMQYNALSHTFQLSSGNSYLFLDAAGNVNVPNGTGTLSPVYAGVPINNQAGNYTCVLSDANKCIRQTAVATTTIPANASVAYPVGTAISFANRVAGNMTIAINSDTLVWAASGASGSRTLGTNGLATALKTDATIWLISGAGLS